MYRIARLTTLCPSHKNFTVKLKHFATATVAAKAKTTAEGEGRGSAIALPVYLYRGANNLLLCGVSLTISLSHHYKTKSFLTLLHSEWPKLYGVLAILSVIGLNNATVLKVNRYFQGK